MDHFVNASGKNLFIPFRIVSIRNNVGVKNLVGPARFELATFTMSM